MSQLNRLIIGVLSLVLLTIMPSYSVQAAIPDPQGYINDYAQLFTEDQKRDIENIIDTSTIDFYLYTTPGLQGNDISTLAQNIFENWLLGENDVIMVLALEEREVHFEVAVDSPLDRGLASLPSNYSGSSSTNPFTSFLDRHFIPHAAEGDFYNGIIEMALELARLNQANQLNLDEEEKDQVPASPVPSNAQQKENEQQVEKQNQEESSKQSGFTFSKFLLVIFLLGLGCALLDRFIDRRKLIKQKKGILSDHQAALVSIHQMELEFEPIIRFSRGKSMEYIREAKDSFYHLLQNATQLSKELELYKINMFCSKAKVKKKIATFREQVDSFTQLITDIKGTIDYYKQTEKEIIPLVEQSQKELKETELLLQQQLNELRYPLDQLVRKKEQFSQALLIATKEVQFDPLYVQELLEGVPTGISELKKEIELIRIQTEEFKKLPERLKLSKQVIDELIEKEKLILTEIDPYSAFERVQEQQSRLERSLQLGEITVSTEILNRINEWLALALDQIKQSIEARNWGMDKISEIEIEVQKYDLDGVHKLKRELQKVQREYDPFHWEKPLAEIEILSSNHLEINQFIPEVKYGLDLKVQKYFEAQKHLTYLIQLLEENQKIEKHILKLKQELDEQSQQLKKEKEGLFTRFSHAMSRIQLHKLYQVSILQQHEQDVRDVLGDINEILEEPTLHVRDLELAVKQLSRYILNFEDQIEATIQEKNRAEKAFAELATSYSNALKRYRAKINRSLYHSEYNELTRNIELALKQGEYQRASSFIEVGEDLIERMRREYQQQVDLEHQRALERQRQRNIQLMEEEQRASSSGSLWGSSGSSSPKSSSSSKGSGSSWGSSSGGSSSWNSSSSGRSSGGSSSWGSSKSSSGGSKGGGSKW